MNVNSQIEWLHRLDIQNIMNNSNVRSNHSLMACCPSSLKICSSLHSRLFFFLSLSRLPPSRAPLPLPDTKLVFHWYNASSNQRSTTHTASWLADRERRTSARVHTTTTTDRCLPSARLASLQHHNYNAFFLSLSFKWTNIHKKNTTITVVKFIYLIQN